MLEDAAAQAPAREAERDLRRPRLRRATARSPGRNSGCRSTSAPIPARIDEMSEAIFREIKALQQERPDRQGGRGDPAGRVARFRDEQPPERLVAVADLRALPGRRGPGRDRAPAGVVRPPDARSRSRPRPRPTSTSSATSR
ncbi:MAG: hypothetical protein MZV70_70705 [Desulfobacterales bacterium]|nr:hypothetical protein [Desulfobacterales bacterium]